MLPTHAASTSVCKASTWAIFANFWGALSEYRSQKECLVKCVRGLSTSQWRKDEKAFVDLAAASIELADCCLRLAEANPEGEFSVGRAHCVIKVL